MICVQYYTALSSPFRVGLFVFTNIFNFQSMSKSICFSTSSHVYASYVMMALLQLRSRTDGGYCSMIRLHMTGLLMRSMLFSGHDPGAEWFRHKVAPLGLSLWLVLVEFWASRPWVGRVELSNEFLFKSNPTLIHLC